MEQTYRTRQQPAPPHCSSWAPFRTTVALPGGRIVSALPRDERSRVSFEVMALRCAVCCVRAVEKKGLDVTKTIVPVIGGHSGKTILPLLSQVGYAATTRYNCSQ